jgi:pyridoxal phosphate-dependent aminotransferase EpsN
MAGNQGVVAAFSFNGNKIITTSGGGMLVSHDSGLIAHAKKLSTQARDSGVAHYEHSEIGFNYRMSSLLAALGRAQLAELAARVAQRRAIRERYQELLSDVPGVRFMPQASYGQSNAWLTCITIEPGEFGADREAVRMALEQARIESRPLWRPMHMQPLYAGCRVFGGKTAAGLFERGLCLPSGSELSPDQQERIVAAITGSRRPSRRGGASSRSAEDRRRLS